MTEYIYRAVERSKWANTGEEVRIARGTNTIQILASIIANVVVVIIIKQLPSEASEINLPGLPGTCPGCAQDAHINLKQTWVGST